MAPKDILHQYIKAPVTPKALLDGVTEAHAKWTERYPDTEGIAHEIKTMDDGTVSIMLVMPEKADRPSA